MNPAFVKYMDDIRAKRTLPVAGDSEHSTGYVPAPIDLSHLKGRSAAARTWAPLPASYDLRALGRVTPVRNQNPYGTCWTFATLGSIESFLLGSGAPESRDFSEMHLAWYAYTGDSSFTTKVLPAGDDPILDQGGNLWKSTALLARRTGPVDEADCPYSTTERPSGHWSNYATRKHLTDVNYLPWTTGKTSDADIKNALMTYGAVAVAFRWESKYYSPANGTYYYDGAGGSNHEVLVVGWDDAFSHDLFSPDAGTNGAWIVKNSWGTGWGDGGYFHLSYNDASLCDGAAFVAGPTTDYDTIYDYDPLGWIGSFGGSASTAWFSNIFTAGNGRGSRRATREDLAAVSFYTATADAAYEIRVFTGVAAGDPVSGTLALGPVGGTIAAPGYHVVALPSPVTLTGGQRFSVVVKLTTPGYVYPVPVEYAAAGYSDAASAYPGESFVSDNGSDWADMVTDVVPSMNVCLKAFSRTVTLTPTPTPSPTPTVTPTPTPVPTSTPTSSPTPSPSPTPFTIPADPSGDVTDAVALEEALAVLGIGASDLNVLKTVIEWLPESDPDAVQPGAQDLLNDTYALTEFLGRLLLEADPDLVAKIEQGSLPQDLFDKALYTVAVYLQEVLSSGSERGAASPRLGAGTNLSEIRSRGGVVEMTLAPGSKQGSFTATFPDAPHAGEAGWKTHRLVLLLGRGSKKWERVFTETDSGTQSREGAAAARGDGQGVDITVTDGLSYDWNDTAGVVRVAMTVMTIGVPDGAQAPTPQARATGGGGGCAASAVAPLALLLIVPLLLTGKRRS
jgi:Synergist-CTERM protein sorting domain-containing protein